MSRLLRKFSKGEVYFVTNRTAEGLPFVPNFLINSFVNGVLARDLARHPGIELCSYLFMGNHYHMILVLNAGGWELKSFMEYLDGEIAKFINRLRGRCNQNVWASRYDAQPMLTPESVFEKMKYVYLNPSSANLVETIGEYPGVSSWTNLTKGVVKSYRYYGSAKLSKLPYGPLPSKFLKSVLRKKSLSKKYTEKYPINVNPFGWTKCFLEYRSRDIEFLKQQLMLEIKEEENKLRKKRAHKGVIGVQNLVSQCFHKHFKSKKYQKRSPCISTCLLARQRYLEEYWDFRSKCREAYLMFKNSFTHVLWPPGAFPPSRPPMSSSVPFER